MDVNTTDLVLPAGLQDFLEENALICPPIPLAIFPLLEEREENFFATDWSVVSQPLNFMEDIDFALEALQEEQGDILEKGYAGFGLAGYGLQSRYFNYLLHMKGVTFAVSLPWGLAYSDPRFEREELKTAYGLIQLCMNTSVPQGRLSVLVNSGACQWKWVDGDNTREGDTLISLVECLEQIEDSESIPQYMWTKV